MSARRSSGNDVLQCRAEILAASARHRPACREFAVNLAVLVIEMRFTGTASRALAVAVHPLDGELAGSGVEVAERFWLRAGISVPRELESALGPWRQVRHAQRAGPAGLVSGGCDAAGQPAPHEVRAVGQAQAEGRAGEVAVAPPKNRACTKLRIGFEPITPDECLPQCGGARWSTPTTPSAALRNPGTAHAGCCFST